MSNKTKLQNNNIDLQGILASIQNLPTGSGTGEDVSEAMAAQDAVIEELKAALADTALPDGGVVEAFAYINATYPSGATCTCTNGTITLTAGTTNGQWVFAVPSSGTWTVTATRDSNVKSDTTDITTEGQLVNITLGFVLQLYTKGTENVSWTVTEGSIVGVHKRNTYLEFYTSSNVTSDYAYITSAKIDLTGYNTIYVKGTYGYASQITIQVYNSSGKLLAETELVEDNDYGNFTKTLEISKIAKTNVSVEITVHAYYPGGAETLATITEVYAE